MSFKQRVLHSIWVIIASVLCRGMKKKRFNKFREEFLPLTSISFHSSDELREKSDIYDVYIAGSDQIWNPDFFIHDLSYFLNFVPSGKRKISYASSFGKATFGNSSHKQECSDLLSEFHSISVREKSGIEIVKELADKTSTVVLDPTLLLSKEEWKTLTNRNEMPEEKYILCYVMPGDKVVTDAIETIARCISKKTGYRIIRLGMKEYKVLQYGNSGCDITAGPVEFLQYFLNAFCVITNSFHGTAFSVNFEKQFYIPINGSIDTNLALHERIMSLLSLINAQNALIPIHEIEDGLDLKAHSVSYDSINKYLKMEKEKSISYLMKAIG